MCPHRSRDTRSGPASAGGDGVYEELYEEWPYLDQGLLVASRSRKVCLACHFCRHHAGVNRILRLTCQQQRGQQQQDRDPQLGVDPQAEGRGFLRDPDGDEHEVHQPGEQLYTHDWAASPELLCSRRNLSDQATRGRQNSWSTSRITTTMVAMAQPRAARSSAATAAEAQHRVPGQRDRRRLRLERVKRFRLRRDGR